MLLPSSASENVFKSTVGDFAALGAEDDNEVMIAMVKQE
jgi:hypothetical protein